MGNPTPSVDDPISVYWQTGCTSCLRVKEYLTRSGVPFRSRDVLKDPEAFEELARFGLRNVPIVVRGDQWANGQALRDVAALCGIPWGEATILPPEELRRRVNAIIAGAARFAAQMPQDRLQDQLPNRPRSYADLIYHIFNVVDTFNEHNEGIRLEFEAFYRTPPADMQTSPALIAYGEDVGRRFNAWFERQGGQDIWQQPANVYYSNPTMHEFLERTAWHSGQHTRQLMWILETLGIAPDRALGTETFGGLPMPLQVWEKEEAGNLAAPAV